MYWVYVITISIYNRNQIPTRNLDNITPYEAWYQKKPNVNHFKVFGCKVFSHVVDEKRKTIDAKGEICNFISYYEKIKSYRLYNRKTTKIIMSRDVIFNEGEV